MLRAAARGGHWGIFRLTAVLLLYALTLFTGATLLFVMQPMVGKMILPLLGGTPAVWSTCMVFFQAALLGGYAYAHALTARVRPARQVLVHLVVLALPFVDLTLAVSPRLLRGGEANPVLDVLTILSLSVGLPSLVVSATAAPAVVHPHRAPGRARSLLSLRGQQPGQHAGPPGLSHSGGAAPAPAGIDLAHPDRALEPGLRDAGRSHRALRADPLVEARARTGAGRRGDGERAGPGREAPAMAAAGSLGRARLRAVEPAPRGHHLHHHRPGRGAAALGAAARDLPADLHPRLRPLAAAAPSRGGGARAAPQPARDLPDGLRPARAHLGHRALALRSALRHRARLPRRPGAGPSGTASPHRVLPADLGGRRAGRALQRSGGPARLFLDDRVSADDGDGLRAPRRAEQPRARAGRRGAARAARGGGRGRADGGALLGVGHRARRLRVPGPGARSQQRAGERVARSRRAPAQKAPDLRPAPRGGLVPATPAAPPGPGPRLGAPDLGLRGRAQQRPDPAEPILLRRAPHLARPRPQGLHRAAPRYHAPRAPEPRALPSRGAAVLLPAQGPDR